MCFVSACWKRKMGIFVKMDKNNSKKKKNTKDGKRKCCATFFEYKFTWTKKGEEAAAATRK